jgi:GNAT superfamily N-acetyltransferase
VRVIPTSPADPATATLLEAYFAERAAGFPVAGGYRTVRPDPAAFAGPDGVFLRIADDDGTALACGGLRPLPDQPGRTLEVKHLYVTPEARGRGLGRALLRALEDAARDRGATRLVLDTNRSLNAAAGLYGSSGFVPVPAYNDNPNATDWYEKSLAEG